MNSRRPLKLTVAAALAAVTLAVTFRPRPPLDGVAARCVGEWTFISPYNPATRIVYRFSPDGGVREEHYYLTSARPTVPALTHVGQWRVEPDGQLVIEPTGALWGLVDAGRDWLRDLLGDGAVARPALRHFYWIDEATEAGIRARSSGGAVVMTPFAGIETRGARSP